MTQEPLKSRREILFLYDIRMGNPNGDPDENRPRQLPDGRFYVTDVRLKRFVRDYIASQGKEILVSNLEGKTTNLTGRVANYLNKKDKSKADGQKLVDILLDAFIDARWFGSSLAFKVGSGRKWNPTPKTLTGATQFNMGEVLNQAEEIQINGTTTFGSDEEKTQGTFTEINVLRYALIAFSGVTNEHSAKLSRMSEADYDTLLKALWNGIRSAGNTRTKVGQVPRLLISVEYKPEEEFQFGNLMDYVQMQPANEKEEKAWASPNDYLLDLSRLLERLDGQKSRIAKVRYEKSPDIQIKKDVPNHWTPLGFDTPA
ncbi:MAG: type I-B CRISPR-associated protein Cas7/Csh2 [Pseudomonadota bacterium]